MQSNNSKGSKRTAPDDDGRNRGGKTSKLTVKDLSDISLKARGLKDSNHGDVFQLNLLMLVFWRVKLSNYAEFALATEHPETESFDDLVFIYRETSDQVRKCRLLQAKHQESYDSTELEASTDEFVTERQLLSKTEGDYALQKYFKSFLKLKQEIKKPGSTLYGCQIENISILTNKKSKLRGDNFEVNVLDREPLLKLSSQFNCLARRYQIRNDSEFCRKLKSLLNTMYSSEDMVEFSNFVETLGIILDYPNRKQVNELLLREMEEYYNVLDGEAKIALYRNEMLKWFAERMCTFLTPGKCFELFATLEARIRSYEIFGSTNAYFAKSIGRYQFKEDNEVQEKIKWFLESGDCRILFLRFDKMELAQPRVSQSFKHIMETSRGSNDAKLGAFTQHFGYIFAFSEQLLDEPFKVNIESELKSDQKGNLLVLDCHPIDHTVLRDLLRDVHGAGCRQRKVIIFSEEKLDLDKLGLSSELKAQYAEKEYTTKLGDLTSDSQKRFRQHCKILLQGKETRVEDVFELEDDDLISSDVLATLILGKELEVGVTLPASIDQECYIERTFGPGLREENPNTRNGQYFLLVNRGYDILVNRGNDLLGRDKYYLSEAKLVARNNRINIFSDLPGMGKSEMLTSLSRKIIQTDFGFAYWVVRIDLNRYSPGFDIERSKRGRKGKWRKRVPVPTLQKGDIPSAVAFLLELFQAQEQHSQLPNDISRKLFQKVVESKSHRTKVALFFDGFDEISPDYVDIVLDLIQTLDQANVANIFLTSRPFMEDVIEKVFADGNTKTFHLDRLSREQEHNLLEREWAYVLNPSENGMRRLKEYAHYIIERHGDLVAGIPLHMHLIADLFEEDCREFLDGEIETPQTVDSMNLWELYEELVTKKFRIYWKEKVGSDGTSVAAGSVQRRDKKQFCERYQILAAFSLLSLDEFQDLCSALKISDTHEETLEAITTGEDQTGFVDAVWNGVPHFVHRTFAEYILTTLFVEHLLSGEQPMIFYQILINFILNGVQSTKFLDTWLYTNFEEIEQTVLCEVRKKALEVLEKSEMVPLWSVNSRELISFIVDSSSIVETLERYPIQVKAYSIQFIQNLEKILSDSDKQRLFAVLERKIRQLVNESKQSEHIPSELIKFIIELVNIYGSYFALEQWQECEFLMEEAAKICSFDQIAFFLNHGTVGQRILQNAFVTAARQGNVDDFTRCLNIVSPNIRNDPLILHNAVEGGNEQICQIVLNFNRDDMKSFLYSQDEKGQRALYLAGCYERSSICKMILKAYIIACEQHRESPGIPVHIKDEDLDLMTSTLLELVQASYSLGPSDAHEICNTWRMEDSIFHLLIYSGAGDIVKIFLENGFKFRGYSYVTVSWLSMLFADGVRYKHTLKILLEHIKNSNSIEFNDIFITALLYEDIGIIEILLESGVDVITKEKSDPVAAVKFTNPYRHEVRNCMHILADKNEPKAGICALILKSLIEAKRVELLSFKNHDENTPLHVAVTSHHEMLVREMLDSVSQVNARTELIKCQQRNGRTVLHCCYNFFFRACYLLELLIGYLDATDIFTINTIDNDGRSVLHDAVRKGDDQAINLLLSKGADLMAVDSQKKSVLHLAMERKDYDFTLFLLNCFDPEHLGKHINAADCDGRTALDYAYQFGIDSIVELLSGKGGKRAAS